jgi:hypothetical protein
VFLNTVLKEILAALFLKGKLNCQRGNIYTQNVAFAASISIRTVVRKTSLEKS